MMRIKAICCEAMAAEICRLAELSPNDVDLEFLPGCLHSLPAAELRARIQERVDAASAPDHDAVALAYGLTKPELAGLAARGIPLVAPLALVEDSRRRRGAVRIESSGWKERCAGSWQQVTYIETGQTSRHCAPGHGDEIAVLRRLLDGEWSGADFVITPPGRRVGDRE